MPDYPNDLILKYISKGVLVDTNLLLLIAVGNYDKSRIEKSNRTRQFTVEDYELVQRVIMTFHRRFTTPNILTEVDNLARQIFSEGEHRALANCLRSMIDKFFEVFSTSQNAASNANYPIIGLADCATVLSAVDKLVLTDDFTLAGKLAGAGLDVLNINHLRHFDV
jgi:hypothetical protein